MINNNFRCSLFSDEWNYRFLEMAKLVSSFSKDPITKVGAVLVRPDKTVASVGYNGFPKGMRDYLDRYENREEKYSRIIHAEMNALIHCKEDISGFSLFTYPLAPCDRCCVALLEAGVKSFVFPCLPEDKERWKKATDRSKEYIEECNANFFEYQFK